MSVPLVYKKQAVTKCYNSRLLYIRIWISKKQKGRTLLIYTGECDYCIIITNVQ